MISNSLQTNPPKWLRSLLVGELMISIIVSLFTVFIFITTYLPRDPNLELTTSFPIEIGLIFFVFALMPWIVVSIYIKLIAKSWNLLRAKYKIILLSLPFLAYTLALTRFILQLIDNFKAIGTPVLTGLKSVFINNFVTNWSIYLVSLIEGFLIYGLLYGLLALYSNYKKITSIPWYNFIHLPGVIFCSLIIYSMLPAYNSQDGTTTFIAEQILRFGCLMIPLAFTAFLFLEYRAINKPPIQ